MNSLRLALSPQQCSALAESATREWLVADGVGGYAMGTVAGLTTRRYHGLLVVAGEHSGSRRVGLVTLDAVVVVGDRRVRLATHEWAGGALDPRGHELMSEFSIVDGVPRWRWSIGPLVIEREVAMAHGRSLVAVVYRIRGAERPVRLELTPLCTWRDAHGERFAGAAPALEVGANGFVFEGTYRVCGPPFTPGGEWYRGQYLREEAHRGLNATQDLWAAGTFHSAFGDADVVSVVAAAAPFDGVLPAGEAVVDAARARTRSVVAAAAPGDETGALLVHAADQFVVRGPGVVAGYPWFGEWSRDTMTSYEGLFLCTNRGEEGRRLLLRAAGTLSEGMLANTADAGGLEYNTADATLWFVHAVSRHVATTGDASLAAELIEALAGVIDFHIAGTRFGIRVDPSDGLLAQGAEGWALTWMDARVGGVAITPRSGKAVDINALWINALGSYAVLAAACKRDAARYAPLETQARASFAREFARPDGRGLYDVVGDGSIRPNQLLAVSLPFGPGAAPAAFDVCRDHLLTPIGLRSLSPEDPRFCPRHRGDPGARDRAYHQGTVWPWLLGPYVDAARALGRDPRPALDAIAGHLRDCGLGSISETADGAPPHSGTGCPFQAWSVAEALRVLSRERDS